MILSREILLSTPRKVAPRGIVYATVGTGLILGALSCVLIFSWLGRRDQNLTTIVALIVLFDGLVLIPLVVLPLRKYRSEARLLKWGVAAPVEIVSRKVATGRSGNFVSLIYAFTDDSGRTVTGSRVLWGDIKADGRTSDPKILDALAAPTVFYDRDDSRTHLFHPSGVAEIRR